MPKLNLFFRMTKVDEAQRLVYGIATAEVVDKSGEICDYESTVPFYKKWSAEMEKASGGKSLGNVREMHSNIAAGVVKQINFDDEKKQIEICTKCVDDSTWNKIMEGVLTGFSQGGEYIKRWKDEIDATLMRYTADPSEISYVDNPCLGPATFQYIKADGTSEMRKLNSVEEKPDPKEIGKVLKQVWAATDGKTFDAKAEAVKYQAGIDAAAVDPVAKKALDAAQAINDMLDKAGVIEPEAEPKKVEKARLKKGLHEVGRVACLLQELDWVHTAIEFEAAQEKDGSPNPGHLQSLLAELGEFLCDLCEEETKELAMGDDMETVASMAMSMRPDHAESLVKVLQKSEKDRLAKNTEATPSEWQVEIIEALEKAGRRHSTADAGRLATMQDHVDDMHGHLGKMHKMHKDMEETTASMGDSTHAEHVTKMKGQLIRMGKCMGKADETHNGMQECMKGLGVGAEGAGGQNGSPPEPTEKMVKLEADNAALVKSVGTITTAFEAVQKRLEVLEKQPKIDGKRPAIFSLEKGNDLPQPGTEDDDAPEYQENVFGSGKSPEQVRRGA